MFIFVILLLGYSFELKEYPSDGDFFVSTLLQTLNEGGNTKLYLDEDKFIGLGFDFDNDFRSHEIIEAELRLHIKEGFGNGKIKICRFRKSFS